MDFAIHSWLDQSDIRRHYGHILMTTRKLRPDGLGEKTVLGLVNKRLRALGLPMMDELKRNIEVCWEERQSSIERGMG